MNQMSQRLFISSFANSDNSYAHLLYSPNFAEKNTRNFFSNCFVSRHNANSYIVTSGLFYEIKNAVYQFSSTCIIKIQDVWGLFLSFSRSFPCMQGTWNMTKIISSINPQDFHYQYCYPVISFLKKMDILCASTFRDNPSYLNGTLSVILQKK